MSSISVQSSITDAIDVDSTNDRYSVINGNHQSKDGDESNHNSAASFRHLSVASGSSFGSRTYGTSYVSDQSETVGRDESFDDDEFGDLDNLSLDSHPMVIDSFVDSACTCLDYPVMLYQKAWLGTETSLLRESKSRSRPTMFHNSTTSTNLSISGAKRRSLRLKNNIISENGETNDEKSSAEDETKNEIKIMRIQPNEDFEFKDIEGSEGKRCNSQTTREKEFLVPADALESDDENCPEDSREKKEIIEEKKTNNEEEQSVSNASTKSMLERAIQKVTKEVEERDITARLSETFKDVDLKVDPPSDAEIMASREGHPPDSYPENHPSLELSTSDRPSESASKKDEKSMGFREDPSGRGQRSQSPIVTEETTTEQASRGSNNSPRTQEREIMSNDEKSLSDSVEIIDVISIDDEDSWTPGSRSDIEHSLSQIRDSRHQDSRNSPRLNDRGGNHDQQDDRPLSADTSNVDELWIEEEAKLSMKTSLSRATSTASKGLAAAQSAEDLWNEEQVKLQTTSDVIFDDPNAREAFLGRRQGRLRDAVIDARNTTRSPSHRQKVQKALKDMDREDSLSSELGENNVRSKSLGRSRPSPEILSVIEQSRSESRSRAQILPRKPVLSQQSSRDPLNAAPYSRRKDLVAVRSIDEGQRIRSSKRDVTKYNPVSRNNLPVDYHRRAGESTSRGPFDEHSNPSHRQSNIDVLIKTSSRQRSKSRDPVGRKGPINVELPSMKYLLNDERDDQESLPSIRPVEGRRPTAAPVEKNWSGYNTAISATEELRKLEKKIERQLRRADLDSQMDQSKEVRRMEKKLSKKLRSIKSDDLDAQRMSPREIRRLEKHLTKTMSSESENRASKLKRIKLKGVTSTRVPVISSSMSKEERHHLQQEPSSHSGRNDLQRTQSYGLPRSPSNKSLSQESQDIRPDGSRVENSKSLRSRYARRGIGRRSYSRVPDTD